MIDRQHGSIEFQCDGCAETLPTGDREFSDAMNTFRFEGWAAMKLDNEWYHYCPMCKGKG